MKTPRPMRCFGGPLDGEFYAPRGPRVRVPNYRKGDEIVELTYAVRLILVNGRTKVRVLVPEHWTDADIVRGIFGDEAA